MAAVSTSLRFGPSALLVRRSAVAARRLFCTEEGSAGAAACKPSLPKDRKNMKPREMVEYLDRYVIGQADAKRAVANALRNRWRRQQLEEELRAEIMPRNMLMVGPTGVGKTEIARRLAKLVEATKFTEVGFHGRDVDSIIRDLLEMAMTRQRSRLEDELRPKATEAAEEQILNALIGPMSAQSDKDTWLAHLRAKLLDDRQIKVEVPVTDNDLYPEWVGGGSDSRKPPQIRVIQVPVAGGAGSRQMEKRTMTVAEARQKLVQVHLDRMIDSDMILASAIRSTEQEGIVFVDEIDKICNSSKGFYHGSDASSEGVQRDLLPILEGSDVSTKHGNVNTDHILFICSGAFHSVKPGDMLAELQGRLPVRVTLSALTEHDFVRILTEPHHNLIEQHKVIISIAPSPPCRVCRVAIGNP
ncbi:hypothetical protein FOZ60_009635 [Perkinsus olseni]|uniref:AAA+ ATPase domain-containing protein n=2 Tax=Perkinsus olseni TaxID=32597 RepID=A0A7J6PET8_PEROL|nr:hypothetical protein FOZ60_009635 [Perkinsus olseni]